MSNTIKFHNTIGLKDNELRNETAVNRSQSDQVFEIFKDGKLYTAPEIFKILKRTNKRVLLNSVRRAITDLCRENKLTITKHMKPGLYRISNHCYQIIDHSKLQFDEYKKYTRTNNPKS
jgi:hypothetical protein